MSELVLLTEDEFDALTPTQQARYLDLLSAELGEPTPSPVQARAMTLADEVDELLYGGAAGPGKSWFMRHRAQALSRRFPGHKTLLLRESFPELRRTHIRDAIAQYAAIPAPERPVYKSSTYEWTFPNDSVIEFGHAATDEDVRSYLSAEYDCIMVDESSEFSEYRLTMLRSRLRTSFTKAALGVKPHMILGSNPGGIGHKYHVDRFIKPTDYGEHVATITDEWNNRKVERTVAFVPARVTDNPHIDPGYIDNLISLPEALRKQYLEGDWDSFEGQFWSEFERERAGRPWHVVPPFEVPPDWPRIRGMDFGNAAPFCCLWIAFDHDGDAYVYREMYEKNVTASEQARRVLKASVMREAGIPKPERIDYTMLDPACWSQHQPGQSIAMQYADEGLYARKGDNQRIAGWTRIRDYLAEDETGKPGLRIFATCTNLIDEMTNALYDKTHVEDLNTKKPDHAMDALRYALMSRPRSYTPKKPPPDMSMEAKVDRHFARMERRKKRRLPEGLGGL